MRRYIESIRSIGQKFQNTLSNLKALIDGERIVEGLERTNVKKFNVYIERVSYKLLIIIDCNSSLIIGIRFF